MLGMEMGGATALIIPARSRYGQARRRPGAGTGGRGSARPRPFATGGGHDLTGLSGRLPAPALFQLLLEARYLGAGEDGHA